MATKKKYKPLTKKEKDFNKSIKKEMIESGLIPPPKKKLNRLKFAKETKQEFKDSNISYYEDILHLIEAISWMLPSEYSGKVSPEQIGVLKVLKLTVDIKKWHEDLKEKGQKQYKVGDFYDQVVAPILRL
ncbi:hypothetical protein [Cellulosilyticum sp. I15G10I2]|uniref:hypothetical protein n=1 Tax=Cellulosilyticum sp. I15G10I2 TaxID=1892843 RepID=UPI00085CD0AF|nr:hypothetical protein [Cellulosilyticum sp. I15G10I2]